MATDHVDARGRANADRITDLPDDVLHSILARLTSTAEAARTSVLSRRWRRVWTGVPALAFRHDYDGVRNLDSIDALLSGHAAATVERLEIAVAAKRVSRARVTRWLRFASQRLAGELRLVLPYARGNDSSMEVVIPFCERFTAISFCFDHRTLRFPLDSAGGAFTALAVLEITQGRVDGGELELVLSSRCPRLKKLALEQVNPQLGSPEGLCIRSNSLEQLKIANMGFQEGIQVATPELQSLSIHSIDVYFHCDLHIVAPKLSELYWCSSYNPTRHRLEEVGRHLRRLRVETTNSTVAAIMRRFDTVDELCLVVSIPRGEHHYQQFLNDINHLTKCEVLVLIYSVAEHAFKQTMIYILNKCAGVRKLVIDSPVYSTVSAF
ncbi:unnamed protein product [Urochloa humidicola]